MKKQLVRISLLQSAKVAAALYFVISLPFAAIFALFAAMMPSGVRGMGGGMSVIIIMPICYAIFGFLFSLLGGWIYNVVASMIGGIEFTTEEVAD
jgi:preprotein translocase subunit SecY